MGDFNDLLYATDKQGRVDHPQSLFTGFHNTIEECQLIELDLNGGNFTWEKSRGTSNWVRERLDRAFATQSWWSKFPLCHLKVVQVSRSDHDPIILELMKVDISRKSFRFRFENIWLKEPNFVTEVKEFWKSIPVAHLIPKLAEVSTYMARWGRTFFHKFREKIKVQKSIMESLGNRTDDDSVQGYLEAKEELNNLFYKEEVYWKQRAKLFWLAEGDDNTRFFHTSASVRKKSNHIAYLRNDNGDCVKDTDGMCQIVHQYFSNLYVGDTVEDGATDFTSPRQVTEDENLMLCAELQFEEFSEAIKQMHPDKSSGPDGLNPAFYQSFWSVMGREVFACCKQWLDSVSFPYDLNNTNVVLIPKKDNADNMKDLRPIALCNVLYKILAKVLANRIKKVLPNIISENQSAFVQDRSITDNVLVAFELIHHLRHKNRGSEGEIALKLDISKAYDRVSWTYLEHRLRAMQFSQKWIDWMLLCVRTVSYQFCLNGSIVGPVIPKRGLRQGDPLSPYLFLLCVEGISNDLDNAVLNGTIHGCQIAPSAPSISHLLFADDSFLFFRGTTMEAHAIKSILINYERCSGQSVNYQKSGIFFSANTRQQKRQELSNILGVHNSIEGSNYLGLPSLVGKSKTRVFGYLKERARKRIQGWYKKPVSRAGKSVLIKNVAQAIPAYTMSCFLLPKSLCQDLEVMFNKFWWRSSGDSGKGLNWLAWKAMTGSKAQGGLGFRSLYGFNIALLGKQCWNMLNNPGSLVSRLFKARYFSNTSMFEAQKGRNSSYIWQGLKTAMDSLRSGFRWVVGNGESICATKDQWIRGKKDYCVVNDHSYAGRSEKVSTYIDAGTKSWMTHQVFENFLLEDARAIISIPLPRNETEDRVVWAGSSSGIYTAKEGYKHWLNLNNIVHNGNHSDGWKRLWSLFIPNKIKNFIWRLCRNTIPTRWSLRFRGVQVPITCPMCNSDIEHLLHVFFDCTFAKQCWQYAGMALNTDHIEDVPIWLLNTLSTGKSESNIKVCTILWGIWTWRNKRVWESKSVSAALTMENSFHHVSEWRSARTRFKRSLGTNVYQPTKHAVKWQPPSNGVLKLNVDASFRSDKENFSLGMVIRDSNGDFVEGRTMCKAPVSSVFEAEAVGVKEALSWVKSKGLTDQVVEVETDSMLVVLGLRSTSRNLLEVGEVIEQCKMLQRELVNTSVHFIRNHANRVAHEFARLPCLVNCHSVFLSLPACVEEAVLRDISV